MLAAAAAVVSAAPETLTDSSPKNNYGFGRETAIRSIRELADAAGVRMSPETPYIVLISDFHLYSQSDAGRKGDVVWSKDIRGDLQKLVGTINGFTPAPALVVITGNLAHNGTAGQYSELKTLLSGLKAPVMAIPGSQDDVPLMKKILDPAMTSNMARPVGNWILVGLDTGKSGSLSKSETAFLRDALAKNASKPAMIFTHHTPVQQPGWEPVRTMRETLVNTVEPHKLPVWFVSGHAHANFLVMMKYDSHPAYPVLTTTSATGSYGYDAPALRVIFLGCDSAPVSAIWRYADASSGFRIDPSVSSWPVYSPEPLDPNRELLDIDRNMRKKLSAGSRGVGEHELYDYVDGSGKMLIAIPAAEYAKNAPLVLEFDVESDYVIKAGPSKNELAEIFNSGKRTVRKTLRWNIPEDLAFGVVYIEITDRTPQDGFGAFVYGMRLLGRPLKHP